MPRTALTLLATIAWTAAVADGLIHLVDGDILVPVAMVVAGVGYLSIRLLAMRSHAAPEVQRSI